MKRSSASMLSSLILITLIGLMGLLFVRRPVSINTPLSSEEQSEEFAIFGVGSPLPTPIPTQDTELRLEDYEFGEPQVILRSPTSFSIVGWLPDNQRILLVQGEPKAVASYQIETFDLNTGESIYYGRFGPMHPKVAWLEKTQKVAFIGYDGGPTYLQVSGRDASESITLIANDVREIAARDDLVVAMKWGVNQPVVFDSKGNAQQTPSVDLSEYEITSDQPFLSIQPHPFDSSVAIFDPGGFVVFDLQSGAIRSFDLGEDNSETISGKRWAADAKWSPEGKQMALLVYVGSPPVPLTRVFILNMESEIITEIPLPMKFITDLEWAPNGQHLLVGGKSDISGDGEILLVDTVSLQHLRIEQVSKSFIYGDTGLNMKWSSDGNKLLIRCVPDASSADAQICLTDVKISKGGL